MSDSLTLTAPGALFASSSILKVVKLPPKSLLSADLWSDDQSSNLSLSTVIPHLAWRKLADGSVQSNTQLVEWDDGSFTLMVGSEAFKVLERPELVHLYQGDCTSMVLSGVARKQLILTPASLASTRQSLAQKEDSLRPKTQITAAQRVSLVSTAVLPVKQVPSRKQPLMTPAFLEEGTSIKALKRSFKRLPAKRTRHSSSSSSESSSSHSSSSASSSSA